MMEPFTVTYYEWNGKRSFIEYIFDVNKNTKSGKNVIISEVVSPFDTIYQLKKKICVYVLKGLISVDDLYLWTSDKCSPFMKDGKFDNEFTRKNDDELLRSFVTIKKGWGVSCITGSQLQIRLNNHDKDTTMYPMASWVKDWVHEHNSQLNMEKSEIENTKSHTSAVTEIESIRVPEKTLRVTGSGHTMIYADISLATSNKNVKLNIDRIFRRFPLNEDVPLAKVGTRNQAKTKVFTPSVLAVLFMILSNTSDELFLFILSLENIVIR